MEHFIAYLIKNLVEDGDAVSVSSRETDEGIFLEISVADADMARVIGKKGRMIHALRTIALAAGARFGCCVRLELLSTAGEEREEIEEEACEEVEREEETPCLAEID